MGWLVAQVRQCVGAQDFYLETLNPSRIVPQSIKKSGWWRGMGRASSP